MKKWIAVLSAAMLSTAVGVVFAQSSGAGGGSAGGASGGMSGGSSASQS
ncbi:MAG: hypothetical protein JWM26_2721, partial [Betaproteobacteria bacterium]|nr:hypothetical protein [Betaproteobacteria bacterium]